MKTIFKKSAFVLFLILIVSFSVVASSAASEYKLNISSRSMNVGLRQYTQVKAEVEGLELQPEIIWSTSDESIATVNADGKVKGLALGNFDVIATAVVNGQTITAKFPMKVVKNENQLNSYLEFNHLLSFQYCYDDCGYYYANDKKSWQKSFGFARIYDYMAPYIGFEYDYERVFFTYDDQDFMVQFWKGQYLIGYGGEIGIYHRDADGLKRDENVLYNAADEKYWPIMDMSVYHQKNEGDAPEDYEFMFRRPVDKYWWCTGFVPGMVRDNDPADELRIEAVITFRDSEMASAFAAELSNLGFKKAESGDTVEVDGYYIEGAAVTVSWQNLIEPDVEKNWANIGLFLIGMIFSVLAKYGFNGFIDLFLQ
ncbi:MAG: DUF4474 domain-containing protein [Clostridia bacterium]|nr:DUF4474 domain-containing protein [Clostridia bacterium]MBO7319760.1 DUF4474 domain-containing protein [Clostridia bacterium]